VGGVSDPFADGLQKAVAANANVPDSGQFATIPQTASLMEFDACLEALGFLQRENGWLRAVSATQPDPPDVLFELEDGSVAAFEFTRVCHGDALHQIKQAAKQGDEAIQNWSPQTFQSQIANDLMRKEAIFDRHLASSTVNRPVVLVMGSDSAMSGLWLCEGFSVTSAVFDEVLIHLGYPGNPENTDSANDPIVHPTIFDAKGT
jgi:hypothetical protein